MDFGEIPTFGIWAVSHDNSLLSTASLRWSSDVQRLNVNCTMYRECIEETSGVFVEDSAKMSGWSFDSEKAAGCIQKTVLYHSELLTNIWQIHGKQRTTS